MTIEFHPRAIFDAQSARRFYRRKGRRILDRFEAELDDAVARVTANPQAWARHILGTRMCRFTRYPHYLVYVEDYSGILILAVAHNKRRVDYWKRRLP